MRSLSKMLLVLAPAFTMVGTSVAQSPERYRANIPFEFAVDGKTLPAGDYKVIIDPTCHLVTFDSTQRLIHARALYRMTDVKSSSENLQLKFAADNSFQGFRGSEDGGATATSNKEIMAKNVKATGKGAAD